jgi:hypothetical protein
MLEREGGDALVKCDDDVRFWLYERISRKYFDIHFDDPVLERELPFPIDEPVHDVAGHLR